MRLTGRRVVLGVSGGIACYKACTIARRLTEAGAAVDVVMTASAAEFVRAPTFEALTGRPVLTSLWERGRALAHLDLAHDRDVIVVAPATAHLLARAAQGLADDVLTTVLLAARVPVLAAPAMNDEMYAHPATHTNVGMLRERGWTLVGPAVGALAEGPSDRPGRMVEPEEVVAWAERLLRERSSGLRGRRVLVTAGPTREHLDPVRVITNPSSGRMGFALAEAAFARGGDVVLVSGPSALPTPTGVRVERVETTAELRDAVERELDAAEIFLMAAAPADYRPVAASSAKVPRDGGARDVRLESTTDVLEATIDRRKNGLVSVGFALETEDGAGRAREKLQRKRLDLIVLNRAGEEGSGFETETNKVTLISKDAEIPLERMSKRDVAERILDEVERRL